MCVCVYHLWLNAISNIRRHRHFLCTFSWIVRGDVNDCIQSIDLIILMYWHLVLWQALIFFPSSIYFMYELSISRMCFTHSNSSTYKMHTIRSSSVMEMLRATLLKISARVRLQTDTKYIRNGNRLYGKISLLYFAVVHTHTQTLKQIYYTRGLLTDCTLIIQSGYERASSHIWYLDAR